MKTKKISRIDIIIFFCLFYPILPVYAKIASINLRNLLCLIFVAVSFILHWKKCKFTFEEHLDISMFFNLDYWEKYSRY